MSIDCILVAQQQRFVGSVGYRHDVDVIELGSGLAPVAVSQNVVPAHFAPDFNFASGWHRPMEQRVKPGDPNTT